MSDIQSAPDLRVMINGRLYGYATALNYTITQGQKPILTVDSAFPAEIAQGASTSMIEGQLTIFKMKGSSPEAAGFIGARTGTNGQSTDPTDSQLGAALYSVLEIYDRLSNNPILKAYYVMFGSQSWSVQAKNIMQGTVTFQGIIADTAPAQVNGGFF
jgi:hypothetical protein